MKNKFIFLILCLIIISCKNVNYSKKKHLSTVPLTNQLYKERYVIYDGGAIGGGVETVYLTDSSCFRKYLGKQFDHELIDVCAISNRAVLIYKIDLYTYELLDAEIYLLSELKAEGEFE